VVVVLVGVVAGLAEDEEELPELPPQPVSAAVVARAAASVSIAASGVLFMGRAPVVVRMLGG